MEDKIWDKKVIIMAHGPKLHKVGPSCYVEIFEDGEEGRYRFV